MSLFARLRPAERVTDMKAVWLLLILAWLRPAFCQQFHHFRTAKPARLRPAAAMVEGNSAPINVPFPWVNTLTEDARSYIFAKTQCSVSTRERASWGKGKRLTASGPLANLAEALDLARGWLLGTLILGEVTEEDRRARADAAEQRRIECFFRVIVYVYFRIVI